MASLNKVMVIGHLGNNAEMRYVGASGQAVVSFSLATNETWNDRDTGQKRERVDWHRIVYWGKAAEAVVEYLTKGRQVYVEGKLQTRKWTAKDGSDRYTTEVRADRLLLLGGSKNGASAKSHPEPEASEASNGIPDEELPF